MAKAQEVDKTPTPQQNPEVVHGEILPHDGDEQL